MAEQRWPNGTPSHDELCALATRLVTAELSTREDRIRFLRLGNDVAKWAMTGADLKWKAGARHG